jgi:starch synthase (maltosyl-transferring)
MNNGGFPFIVIEGISPCIADGYFPVKCTVGDKFFVEADIFKEGHDALQAVLLFKKANHSQWNQVPMQLMGNARWQGFFTPMDNARYLYTIEAWSAGEGSRTRCKDVFELMVDRKAAAYSTWYELFPRSQGQVPEQSGTFEDCILRLPDIKKMGFDVIYLTPIHPIGMTNRKGIDNALIAETASPGSPWAIGNKTGGHKSIHPALGGLNEFKSFVDNARDLGIEIALDIAFQCSPDHPYVKDHPQWFYHHPDGSIQCAENPPKKYEDIYPLNFYGEDWQNLWEELKSIITFWIEKGVNIFRVDNPHTKPLYFWKWLIDQIQKDYPQVIFLSEAFSQPKIMKFLAKAGFTQSYTYFTWRNLKEELRSYMQELINSDMKYYFRGNFFVNTPDILPEYLQKGGAPAFRIRLLLAATLSSSYGIYSGFELCEDQARPGSEEYARSEKYEIKTRDWNKPGNIKDLIIRVNAIRRQNPALQEYKNLEFFETRNEHVLCYGKRTTDNSNMIVVVVNLDPFSAHEDLVTLPLSKLGIKEWQTYQMHDLLTEDTYLWKGASNYVRLDPLQNPAHIFLVQP